MPLAIHVWSKKEARTLKVGSVELLVGSHARQSSNLQISEWLLLLLRMAIVALAVLLMAGPRWKVPGKADRVAYLVEPSLAGDPGLVPVLDSLAAKAGVSLLQEGFPPWENGMEITDHGTPPYWQLVQMMDSLAPDSLVIFARAHVRGIKGMRPPTHKKIHWVVQGEGEEIETPLLAERGAQGMVTVSLLSQGQGTRYKNRPLPDGLSMEKGDSLPLSWGGSLRMLPLIKLDSLRVHIYVGTQADHSLPYIQAALSAVSRYLGRNLDLKRYGPGETTRDAGDLNLWLRETPVEGPKGRWLVQREDPMARALIEQKGDSLYHLTARLDTKNTVEEHFVRQLLPLLAPDPLPIKKAGDLDLRQMDIKQFQPRYDPSKTQKDLARMLDISPWVLLALALLLVAERSISKIRKQ